MTALATPVGRGRVRVVVGYGLVAACLPYALVKVLWLAGVTVGVPAGSPAAGPGFLVANVVTLVMDGVAVALALALTHDRGRLPAAPLLAVGWVGTGFLVPTVGQVALGFGYGLLTTGRLVSIDGGLVTDNTYTLVYGGFAVQGILLGAAFALYARDRWAVPLSGVAAPHLGPAQRRAVGTLAVAAAVGAAAVGALRLVEAIAAPPGWHEHWTAEIRLTHGVEGVVMLLAVPGVLALTGSPLVPAWLRRRSRLQVAALAWLGGGALFSWGAGRTFVQIVRAPMSELVHLVDRVADLTAALSGLTVALVGVVVLAAARDEEDGGR